MQTINARKAINTQLWLIIAVYLVMLSLTLGTAVGGDDSYYSKMAETRPLLEWWWERYRFWSGRVFIDLLTVATITWSWFWHLAIPATVLLLAFSLIRLVGWQTTPAKLILVLALFAVAPAKVMGESFYWVTGFYNYLLPTALALFCFGEITTPKEHRSLWRSILAVISVLIFAYQEQVTILFCLALCLSLYYERTPLKWFVLVFTLFNSLFLFLAPGNASRVLASTYLYFPNYQDFGLLQKVFLGMDKLYQVFVMPDNWPLVYLLITLVILSGLKSSRSFSERISSALLVFYIAFFFLQNQLGVDLKTPLLELDYTGKITSGAVSKGAMYGGYVVMLLVMSSVLTLLFGLFQHNKGSQAAFVCLLLAVMSVVMLGFSPTVYASNYRVQMLFEVGLILALLFLLRSAEWRSLLPQTMCTKLYGIESDVQK